MKRFHLRVAELLHFILLLEVAWKSAVQLCSKRAQSSRPQACVFLLLDSNTSYSVASRLPVIDFCFEQPNSTTALMEAARAGNLGCVKVLVKAGASLTAKDVSTWLSNVFIALSS